MSASAPDSADPAEATATAADVVETPEVAESSAAAVTADGETVTQADGELASNLNQNADPKAGRDTTDDSAAELASTCALLTEQLQTVTAERDDYLDQLQRQRAEFQNFRRRIDAERQQQISAGVSRLVESLLPVLDGCDAAASQGHNEVATVGQALMVALGKAGLERIDAIGKPFDPTQHEAVTIETAPEIEDGPSDTVVMDAVGSPAANVNESAAGAPASDSGASDSVASDSGANDFSASDGGDVQQIVTAELRSGFRFDGRVLRAVMVKVRTT